MGKHKIHTWGVRSGHSQETITQIVSYLQSHPANYCSQMEMLLELIYQAMFYIVNTPFISSLAAYLFFIDI